MPPFDLGLIHKSGKIAGQNFSEKIGFLLSHFNTFFSTKKSMRPPTIWAKGIAPVWGEGVFGIGSFKEVLQEDPFSEIGITGPVSFSFCSATEFLHLLFRLEKIIPVGFK